MPLAGLYRKALTFHNLALQDSEGAVETPGKQDDGISAEERAKISSHIEDMLAESRVQVSPQALAYTPKRRGALLPIISNVAVFAIFILVGLVIFRLLNHQEKFIASGQAVVQGAENKLIAEIKKETDQQLRAGIRPSLIPSRSFRPSPRSSSSFGTRQILRSRRRRMRSGRTSTRGSRRKRLPLKNRAFPRRRNPGS